MSDLLSKLFWIGKGVGWINVPRRVRHMIETKSGLLRKRLAPRKYTEQPYLTQLNSASVDAEWKFRRDHFFKRPKRNDLCALVGDDIWKQHVADVCQQALAGQYPYFSYQSVELGWPPDFNLDPVNGIQWPVGEFCLDHTRSGPPRDDIKLVWEASRLSLAFYFIRNYCYTENEEWSESFWQLVESWIDQNPVNETVAWGCGQEVSFRLLAVLFGAILSLDSSVTSMSRLATVRRLAWQSGKRIEANINYAISQGNNHGLSEAAGLWTIGLLFPEFADAKRWKKKGQFWLEELARRQIYSDGSYIQHSFNYHRVAMDVMMWAWQVGKYCDCQLSSKYLESLGRLATWLEPFVDQRTGRVPNYGANDGANVLPLSCTDYLDYRPVLNSALRITGQSERIAGSGIWDEKSLWLAGDNTANRNVIKSKSAEVPVVGGYYKLGSEESNLFIRCTTYRHRPSHNDMLHIDYWFNGHNVLRDAGTYRYYHNDPKVKSSYYATSSHNTLQQGDLEQMTKGPQFLWFHWPNGVYDGVIDGWHQYTCQWTHSTQKPLIAIRRIQLDAQTFTVEDRFSNDQPFSSYWHLSPEIEWESGRGLNSRLTVVNGQKWEIKIDCDQLREFTSQESLYYNQTRTRPALQAIGTKIVSVFGPVQ